MEVKIFKPDDDRSVERGVSVRIDDYDLWNLDVTLAYIIYPALVRLREEKNGSPIVDLDDVPESLGNRNDEDAIHDRWDYVLDEMIYAFHELQRDWERDYQYEGIKEGCSVITPTIPGFNWEPFSVDEKGVQENWRRIQEGLRLFAKYYFHLWD